MPRAGSILAGGDWRDRHANTMELWVASHCG